jgi:large subunit ribosomal protein L18
MITKNAKRLKRKLRIRAKVSGTADRPRLAVFRSNKALYVQLVNDADATTVCSASVKGSTVVNAKKLGADVIALAKKHHIKAVVFDRGGYRYHGVVKALAEAVREGGILA